MTLDTRHIDPDVDRAATSDLHHVAQSIDRCRFAHHAQVGYKVPGLDMVDQCNRAMHGRTFFISRDDEAYAPVLLLRHGSHESGNARLHIDCATPVEQISPDFRRERVAGPARAGRHHVQMPGKGEMPTFPRACTRCKEILYGAVGRFTGYKPVNLEANWPQGRFQNVENRPCSGCHAWSSDQVLSQPDCIGHLLRLA